MQLINNTRYLNSALNPFVLPDKSGSVKFGKQ